MTLFLVAGNDHESAVARFDERQNELTSVNDQVATAEAERQRAEERNKALKSDNADMTGCVEAMRHYLWDGLADAARTAAVREVFTKCQ
ncbi:hypothetical protein JOF56_010971 [Kibdelosporangium banguiense]|uniref:Uncharacterized protein n=1 Tax=Kibdelosporangium banguiense TaxID=1365924 RepID=A0ABS4U1T7_9PSEU|nr:hypothetical protein [Kibdelosporangium banguiense]MBP2330586.1 hypothetical protein [Kibdelosporangium banguiense]